MAAKLTAASTGALTQPKTLDVLDTRGPASTPPSRETTTFHLFPYLPPELQFIIWEFAMAKPRTVSLDPRPVLKKSSRKVAMPHLRTIQKRDRRLRQYRLVRKYQQVPRIFYVNRDTQRLANLRYNIRFSVNYTQMNGNGCVLAHYMACPDDLVQLYTNYMTMHGDYHRIQNIIDTGHCRTRNFWHNYMPPTGGLELDRLAGSILGNYSQWNGFLSGILSKFTDLRTCYVVLAASRDSVRRGIGPDKLEEFKQVPGLMPLLLRKQEELINRAVVPPLSCSEFVDKLKFVEFSSA
ncbi:hypothetical protein F4779DRAFT_621209 [Xylariaceae sp. FL0662B]|nr:hypothetical protein F4779DRAFT_621209 [Xylariaceae sp. FL0662B]